MVTFRKAKEEDIEIIRKIALAAWSVAYSSILSQPQLEYMLELFYSRDSLKKQMIGGHDFILAIGEDFQPLGFASYSEHKDARGIYHLNKLYLYPEEKSKGAGKLLLEEVMKSIRASGGVELQLNVNRHNPALYFYKKQGFEILREEDIDIGEGYYMNDYIMYRQLV